MHEFLQEDGKDRQIEQLKREADHWKDRALEAERREVSLHRAIADIKKIIENA